MIDTTGNINQQETSERWNKKKLEQRLPDCFRAFSQKDPWDKVVR